MPVAIDVNDCEEPICYFIKKHMQDKYNLL